MDIIREALNLDHSKIDICCGNNCGKPCGTQCLAEIQQPGIDTQN